MGTPKVRPSRGDDPVKVDAKHYHVEFENDRVRVLRIRYGRREKSAMHSHPALIAIFLTDQHSRFTYPDGTTEDIKAKAGDVRYMGPLEHLPENLGDAPMELIAVELKS